MFGQTSDLVLQITHGITNRMTGGGTASCLQTLEAGALGEGWSDAMAEYVQICASYICASLSDASCSWVHQNSTTIEDFAIGPYVTNNPAGVRTYLYSTDTTTNPLTYSSLSSLTDVHAMGEVWANILHNMLAALVSTHGFSQNAREDPA